MYLWSDSGKNNNIERGHLKLAGAQASSSTGNTTQILFGNGNADGTIFNEHVAVTSNTNCLVVNPSSTSSEGQILLYCGSAPKIKVNGTEVSLSNHNHSSAYITSLTHNHGSAYITSLTHNHNAYLTSAASTTHSHDLGHSHSIYITSLSHGHTGYITSLSHNHTEFAITNHTHDRFKGIYTANGGQQPPNYFGTGYVGSLMSNYNPRTLNTNISADTSYKNWLYMDSYTGTDAGGTTAIGISRTTGKTYVLQSAATRTEWATAKELCTTEHTHGAYVATDHSHTNYAISTHGHGNAYVTSLSHSHSQYSVTTHSHAHAHTEYISSPLASPNTLKFTAQTTTYYTPSVLALATSPFTDSWHDVFAFQYLTSLTGWSISDHETTTNGSNWTTSTTVLTKLFCAKEGDQMTILDANTLARRFTLYNGDGQFDNAQISWYEFSVGWTKIFSNFTFKVETSSNKSTWTTICETTISSNATPVYVRGDEAATVMKSYLRFTFTKTTNKPTDTTKGTVNISCLRALSKRKGDQGKSKEEEFPYTWDTSANLLPKKSNTSNLGTETIKWNNIYAQSGIYVNGTSVSLSNHNHSFATTTHTHSGYASLTNGNASTAYYLMGTPSTIGTTLYRNNTGGPFMQGADLYAGSDINLKKDITSISDEFTNELFKKNDITYNFKWKEDNKESDGFIAQWIEDIMPEVVDDGEGIKHVNYNAALSKVVGAMFKKIKQLETTIQQQQNEINELKKGES